jgi:L-iditol 2-dehydrogenase
VKALSLTAPDRLAYGDVPDPVVGPEDVLIGVRACGICGSDVHGLDGRTGRRIPPIIMGHEAAGTIREVGPGVEGWRAGDRVTFDSTVWCGTCDACRHGRVNLCLRRRVVGVSTAEHRHDGAFAELVVVPARILHRLPDEVTDVQGALVEPLAVALHAIARAGDVVERPVIMGAGFIGLLLVQALATRGCERIVAVDVDEGRLGRAEALGAVPVRAGSEDELKAAITGLTSGEGPDVVFEAVGVGETVASAMALVRAGGRVVLVGNLAPRVDLALQAAVSRELTILGSAASAGEYPQALALIAGRRVDVDALVSSVVPLREGESWMRRLQAGDRSLLKVVLQP